MVLAGEAVKLINDKNALVVDVRTEKEYKEGHVMNALHIPLGMLGDRIQELQAYKNHAVVMVCRSGARSAQAATKLKKQGFTNVHNIGGGMLAWERVKLPITTKVGKPPKPELEKPELGDAEVDETTETKNPVLVYCTHEHPFCTRAIELLEAKNVGFDEIRIDEDTDKRSEMEARSGQTSVPQIFIGDVYVGDCDDMYALEDKGELDALLGPQDEPAANSKPQDSVA
jgi:GrxC family glutaredoxin